MMWVSLDGGCIEAVLFQSDSFVSIESEKRSFKPSVSEDPVQNKNYETQTLPNFYHSTCNIPGQLV